MSDGTLLGAVKRGSENALSRVIDKYADSVCNTIKKTCGDILTHEDIEEVASEVFFSLWENSGSVEILKGWLSSTARAKAKLRLRDKRAEPPVLDEYYSGKSDTAEDMIISGYSRETVEAAIPLLDSPDREIFYSYYYDSKLIVTIASETSLTESEVKERVVASRERIRQYLISQEVFGDV